MCAHRRLPRQRASRACSRLLVGGTLVASSKTGGCDVPSDRDGRPRSGTRPRKPDAALLDDESRAKRSMDAVENRRRPSHPTAELYGTLDSGALERMSRDAGRARCCDSTLTLRSWARKSRNARQCSADEQRASEAWGVAKRSGVRAVREHARFENSVAIGSRARRSRGRDGLTPERRSWTTPATRPERASRAGTKAVRGRASVKEIHAGEERRAIRGSAFRCKTQRCVPNGSDGIRKRCAETSQGVA